eukprot:CAMPEP_0173223902 /NCGR_PEP_ID=MMETSP1142-20121109/4040_1 /TAXON_ID=483371 /ORGANISM="non described non described, Strain CCMP2298" /LENGTH=61 /DNA_ID=CAMNT_0014152107 /DNA_START=536 /DNA_END=718 /DNA_ORIENTATION=-
MAALRLLSKKMRALADVHYLHRARAGAGAGAGRRLTQSPRRRGVSFCLNSGQLFVWVDFVD